MTSTMSILSVQNKLRAIQLDKEQSTSSDTSDHNTCESRPAQLGLSISDKRKWATSRDNSRDPSRAPTKRARETPLASLEKPCDKCLSIRWDNMTREMGFGARMDWKGVPFDHVGTHYRNIPSNSTCPLCRQLSAPWINEFLKKRHPTPWKAVEDYGDHIQIFWQLRHLPHVNDFPSSRKILGEHNAPYHIAIVPAFRRDWKNEIRAHIASNGLVIVMPKEQQETRLFLPQQVSRKFEPDMVLSWLECCNSHKKQCNIEAPDVPGMKLIDCEAHGLIRREQRPNGKYVALSYVWGKPPISKPAISASATKETSQKEKNALTLPKNLPLTIQDAIRVTKTLGYRYLWVDKYCIDQENAAEKQSQCNRMGDIYAGAQLTIFALGDDSHYGLPGVSTRPRLQQLQSASIGRYDFVSAMLDPQLAIQESTWSSRGWTYQEGLFSTRRLFFTDHQIYFECNAMNCAENFKSDLEVIHIQNGQRFRAFHRAGEYVCGNSNQFSHVMVKESEANHRKVDIVRRFQHQILQYSKRELTNEDDVLNAFAGSARFYAKTSAKIVTLAGIAIPAPFANLGDAAAERLDHLSYALAWTHRMRGAGGSDGGNSNNQSQSSGAAWGPWTQFDNPQPQRRGGFPSWSWAGWFGEVGIRKDLPYCWTSDLSSVKIGFREKDLQGSESEDYTWLNNATKLKQHLIARLLTASVLHFDAYVIDPKKLYFPTRKPDATPKEIEAETVQVYLSVGVLSIEQLQQELLEGECKCLVLGTYGKPRKDIIRAIRAKDIKGKKAKSRRIDKFMPGEPDAIVCLVVHVNKGRSYRIGLLKILIDRERDSHILRPWILAGGKSRFSLF